MICDPQNLLGAEARALATALAIADKALWQIATGAAALSVPLGAYLYVQSAEILLAPTSAGLPFAHRLTDQAVREGGCDALIISCAGTPSGGAFPQFALGLWSPRPTAWTLPVWPWLSRDGGLWFGPATYELEVDAWPLRQRRLKAEPAPWRTVRDHEAGRARAMGWLDGVIR